MSFLSFIGFNATGAQFLSQIYRRPEFTKFLDNLNEKATSAETLQQFALNFILTNLDPYVVPFLTTTENLNIFKNNSLSRAEQSKLFSRKLLDHLSNCAHELDPLYFVRSIFNFEYLQKLLREQILGLHRIPEIKKAESPTDVYKIIVNEFSRNINSILGLLVEPMNYYAQYEFNDATCRLMSSFNTVYEYKSPVFTNNDNSDTDTPPNNLKRSRAMEGLPTKSDLPEDTKKPKN